MTLIRQPSDQSAREGSPEVHSLLTADDCDLELLFRGRDPLPRGFKFKLGSSTVFYTSASERRTPPLWIAWRLDQRIPVILCDQWTPQQVKALRFMVNHPVTWASVITQNLGSTRMKSAFPASCGSYRN
jgi:hypothetical protein